MRIPIQNGKTFYMEQKLYDNLQELIKLNHKDYDSIIPVWGSVGSGKSTIAIQSLTAIIPDFSLKNVAFNGEEFEDFVHIGSKPQFDGVNIDEAVDGMNAKEHYKQINIRIEKLLAKMRLKNMYVTACMPRLKDFSEFTIQRAVLGIKCITIRKERGYFFGFSPKRLQQVYYAERDRKKAWQVHYNFRGRFFDGMGNIGKDEYKQAKANAFINYYSKNKKNLTYVNRDLDLALKWREKGLSYRDIAKLLGKTHPTVIEMLQKHANSLGNKGF